jgi:hypothetical protein
MPIRRSATLAAVAALSLLALGAAPAPASTSLRSDPGGGLLTGSTTITNTSSGVATLTTGSGSITCSNTSFTATATSNSSATTIGGSLNTLTFTTCTDTIPLVTFAGCHRHGATLPAVSVNGSTGTVTLTDVIVRCSVFASNQGCYLTAATLNGTVNNALSTLTYTNVPVTGISFPTTDAVAPGACITSGNFSVTLRHIVQSGTNRTVTLQP